MSLFHLLSIRLECCISNASASYHEKAKTRGWRLRHPQRSEFSGLCEDSWSDGAWVVCRHTLEGHGGWVSDCAITAASDTAITVSGDDLAVVWDILSGGCKNVLEGHTGEVLSVMLTKRGRFAVTGAPPLCTPLAGYGLSCNKALQCDLAQIARPLKLKKESISCLSD